MDTPERDGRPEAGGLLSNQVEWKGVGGTGELRLASAQMCPASDISKRQGSVSSERQSSGEVPVKRSSILTWSGSKTRGLGHGRQASRLCCPKALWLKNISGNRDETANKQRPFIIQQPALCLRMQMLLLESCGSNTALPLSNGAAGCWLDCHGLPVSRSLEGRLMVGRDVKSSVNKVTRNRATQ